MNNIFDVDLEEIRDNERLIEIKKFMKVNCGYLSAPLFLLFWVADLLYAPHYKFEFLSLRILIVFSNILIIKNIDKINNSITAQRVSLAHTALNANVITTMILMTEGLESPYYAGINLVYIGAMTFVPWTKKFLMGCIIVVWVPYILGGLTLFGSFNWRTIILNQFFISATIVIIHVVRHFTEKLREQDVRSKHELALEIRDRDQIIDKQTKQAVKLQEMSRQFSPQIIHAIQKGKISLESNLHERDICAIFIDIVNSTEKVVNIDKNDLNKVIKMFIDDTMGVLLKYDITIDKFLGDGILAFSNDPLEQENYILRVINATCEIFKRLEQNNSFYQEHWGDDLKIKVGIAQGKASVGFYGDEKTIKSYTAIGKVVNLASRLCSAAGENEVLISEDVKNSVSDMNYSIFKKGDIRLKGFKKTVAAYSLDPDSVEHYGGSLIFCPEGHGILHLQVEGGIYKFKCRVCNYVLAGEDELDMFFKKGA
ncbi:MAG: adenylate/guanylate cyclase domain-containing protein [Halobacteriovoraceae bacterium]|nr:adenylate/guanylate cyclase domain-containing protein [Halobacteriovoraceae bacterium]